MFVILTTKVNYSNSILIGARSSTLVYKLLTIYGVNDDKRGTLKFLSTPVVSYVDIATYQYKNIPYS
jgi:hypothetical protein